MCCVTCGSEGGQPDGTEGMKEQKVRRSKRRLGPSEGIWTLFWRQQGASEDYNQNVTWSQLCLTTSIWYDLQVKLQGREERGEGFGDYPHFWGSAADYSKPLL